MRSKQHTEESEEAKRKTALHSAITLLMGNWRIHFSEQQYKTILARALNTCVEDHKIIINAYLISNRKLYLVLSTRYHSVENSLKYFHKKLREEILRQSNWKELRDEQPHSHIHLFERLPSCNYELVQLISGRTVNLLYYSIHLEKLKHYIHHHSFCSAIDYRGGTGPVDVLLLKDKHKYIHLYSWEMEENN